MQGFSFTQADDPEMAAIERRRRLAELLSQQAGQPVQPISPNAPISPLSGLAKMLRGYTAGSGMRKADEQEKSYGQKFQQTLASALGAPTPEARIAALGQSSNPQLQMLAMQIRAQDEQRQAERADKTMTTLTEDEEKALGLPTAGMYQRSAYGDVKPVWEPPKPDTKSEGLMAQERQLINERAGAEAANRAPQQPAAPSISSIVDPKNPSRSITVDARVFNPQKYMQGDTSGILGESPKLGDAAKNTAMLQKKLPAAKQAVSIANSSMDMLIKDASELKNHPGLDNITGWIAGRTPTVSQEGRNAQELLNSIKSKTFVDVLQAMRAASKTGGAVGNVSDREGDRLENAWAALGQSQDTETFKRRMDDLINIARDFKSRTQTAFDDEYADVGEQSQSSGGLNEDEAAELQRLRQELAQ